MAASTDDPALVDYEKMILRSLENAKATQPYRTLLNGRDLNSMTVRYWQTHEPTKPRPPHFSSVGFKSLTGTHGLLEYLEKKKYIKCEGTRFEILSTDYHPGVPQDFPLRRRSSSMRSLPSWNFDEDSMSDDGYGGFSRGSTADNLMNELLHGGSDSDREASSAGGGDGMICPSCQKNIVGVEINLHLDECLTRKMLEEESNARRDNSDNSAPSSPQRRGGLHAKRKFGHRDLGSSGGLELDMDPLLFPPSATRPKLNNSNDVLQVAPAAPVPPARAASPNPQQLLGGRVPTQLLGLISAPASPAPPQIPAAPAPPPMVKKDSQDFDPRYAARTLRTAIPDKECPICLDTFEAGNVIATLHCMCMFHKPCILNWFTKQECCPNHTDLDLHSGLRKPS